MPEIPESGINSTNKCSDTIDENTLHTSEESPNPNSKPARKTRSKRPGSGTNVSSVRHEPPPRYLVTDLNRLTFKSGESTYRADDTEHTFLWMKFISDYADVTGKVDWDDLEERAHFLNMLYEFCEAQGIPFPLEETQAKNIIENI